MRKILFTFATVCLGITAASAQDVYVYKADSSQPLASVSNVQRIEFNSGAIDIVSKDGVQKNVSLDALDYLLFYNKEFVNSVRNASTSKNIAISFDGKQVSVESAETISKVEVYTSDGIKYASVSPKAKSARLSTASYPAGVYIVKAVAGKEAAINEIVKK